MIPLIELRKLANNELFYLINEQGNYRLYVKVEDMTDGTTRCRQYYDTIRPDVYFDRSTKVMKIPKNIQKCLKSATK